MSVSPEVLFSRLSLTHLVRLTSVKDPLQRTFYEISAISGVWSVKELEQAYERLSFEVQKSGVSAEEFARKSEVMQLIKYLNNQEKGGTGVS